MAYENLALITMNMGWYEEHMAANKTVDFYKDGVWLLDGATMVNASDPGPAPGQVRFSESGIDVFLLDGIMQVCLCFVLF